MKYLQVHFGNMTKVTRVDLQHVGGDKIQEYKLHYSLDNINWVDKETVSLFVLNVTRILYNLVLNDVNRVWFLMKNIHFY